MRVKAESMGGMVHFSSEEGEGFEIRLSLPASVKKARSARPKAGEERLAPPAGQAPGAEPGGADTAPAEGGTNTDGGRDPL